MSYNVPPKGDIRKLPKWAQDYIYGLKHEIDEQDDHIHALSSQHPGSNLMLDPMTRPSVELPPDSRIKFYLGKLHEEHRDLIEVHHNRQDPSKIEVTAYGGPLIVQPRVANAVSIMQGKY